MVTILPRSAWTDTPNGRAGRTLSASRVDAITIHYPADGDHALAGLNQSAVASRLRAYRTLHRNKGWADIGYNYAIDGAGRIWFLTGNNVGAHAGLVGNPSSVGVLFVIGNKEQPTVAALAALVALRKQLLAAYAKAKRVQGHQQVPGNSTSCPGGPLMVRIKAGTILTPGTGTPTPTTPPVAVWGEAGTWVIGSTGAAVTRLGERIRVWFAHYGIADPYKVGPGSPFSAIDRAAVAAFQVRQGWTGEDADGYPGPETFKLLAAAPPTAPTTPTPGKPKTQSATVLTINLASRNADVNKKYGAWKTKRVKKAAAFILTRKALFVVVQECYAAQRPELDALIVDEYDRVATKGGRVIYRRKGGPAVVGGSKWTDMLPGAGTKYAVARKFRFDSGAVLNLSNAHTSYETSAKGVAKRGKEVPSLITWMRKEYPEGYDLFVGDFNSPAGGTTRRDDVGPIFTRHGLRDLRHDVAAMVGRGAYHLDRAFAGLIRATGIRVYATDFTDHPAVLFTISIPTT